MLFLYSETLDFPRYYQVKVLNLISLPSPRRCCILLSAFSLSSGQDVAFTFTEQVAGVLVLPYTDPRERVNRVQAIRFISNFPPDCNETPWCITPNLSLASPLVFTLVNKPMVQLAVNNRQSGSLSRLPLFSLLFAEKALRGKKIYLSICLIIFFNPLFHGAVLCRAARDAEGLCARSTPGQAGCCAPALGSMDAARNLLPVPAPSSQLKHAVRRLLKCCSWWVQRARLDRGW